MRHDAHHARRAVGKHHAVPHPHHRDRAEEHERAVDARQIARRRHRKRQRGQDRTGKDHVVRPHLHGQAPGQEVAQHVADRRRREPVADLGRGHVEHLLAHEGRAAHIGEERARREGHGQRVAPEPARPRQHGVIGDLGPQAGAAARCRLAHVGVGQPQHPRARRAQDHEHRAPARRLVDETAEDRRDHRHDRHPHGDVADPAGRRVARHHVAHHRPRQRKPRRHRRLRHAEHQEPPGGRRRDRPHCRRDEDRERPQHHRPPAPAVAQRADQQLHDGRGDQIGRDRQLHGAVIHAEIPGHAGQRRQEHVHAERAYPRQQDQRQGMRRGAGRAASSSRERQTRPRDR